MKLRIKGNSIRLRLTRTEVARLCSGERLEEQTLFPAGAFKYRLQLTGDPAISAKFENGNMSVFLPREMSAGWAENNTVGFSGNMKLTGADSLFILVEKDFICLDETTEDQSDNYENPNKTC